MLLANVDRVYFLVRLANQVFVSVRFRAWKARVLKSETGENLEFKSSLFRIARTHVRARERGRPRDVIDLCSSLLFQRERQGLAEFISKNSSNRIRARGKYQSDDDVCVD